MGIVLDALALGVDVFNSALELGSAVGPAALAVLRSALRGGALARTTCVSPGPFLRLGVATDMRALSPGKAKVTTGDLRRATVDHMSTK